MNKDNKRKGGGKEEKRGGRKTQRGMLTLSLLGWMLCAASGSAESLSARTLLQSSHKLNGLYLPYAGL